MPPETIAFEDPSSIDRSLDPDLVNPTIVPAYPMLLEPVVDEETVSTCPSANSSSAEVPVVEPVVTVSSEATVSVSLPKAPSSRDANPWLQTSPSLATNDCASEPSAVFVPASADCVDGSAIVTPPVTVTHEW